MPNICSYSMMVQGKPEKVDEFIKVMKADYSYYEDKCECSFDRHLFRVFDADVYTDETVGDIRKASISGSCAWSVFSCMCEGNSTYYTDMKKDYTDEVFKGTTLGREAELLGISIEVFSEEGGCGFQEHIAYVGSEVEAEDCVDWVENYIGDEEDLENYNEEHGTNYTMEDAANHEDKFPEGGFENWDYTDYSEKLKQIYAEEAVVNG